ncbi:MAG: hypothetical protein L3J03_10565 [Desulfobacterales bacterium]|nr:hypothetical protein [Desulfobacterales bacterium]
MDLKEYRIVRRHVVVWTLAVLLLCTASVGGAVTVAVIPLEDLSRGGRNGVSLELTDYLARKLADRGVELVPEPEVIAYLSRNRIRRAGYFDSRNILQTRDQLGADFLLFGTVCQLKDDKTSPALGLSLYLVRTDDASPVWTRSMGMSIIDVQRLLGISEPETMEDLLPLLTRNILADWPDNLEEIAVRPLRQFGRKSIAMNVDLDTVLLEPRFARSGEEIRCRVRIRIRNGAVEKPRVFFRVGNRVLFAGEVRPDPFRLVEHPLPYNDMPHNEVMRETPHNEAGIDAPLDSAGLDRRIYEYEAIWNSSEVAEDRLAANAAEEPVRLASASMDPIDLEGIWSGGRTGETVSIPVSLVMHWPSGENKSMYLGRYTLDDQPPQLTLQPRGRRINEIMAFREVIRIYPRFIRKEAIDRWEITVLDKDDRMVIREAKKGAVPPFFVWAGQTMKGYPTSPGQYTVRVRAWDRAGNEGEAVAQVAFFPDPPRVRFDAVDGDRSLALTLRSQGEVPLDYWRMELWSRNNELVKVVDGVQLPVTVEISREQAGQLNGVVFLKNILGARSQDKIDNLLLADRSETPEEAGPEAPAEPVPVESDWLSDF